MRARPARAKCRATASPWRGASGATLANLEMQWWHTNDIADPPTWQRMQVYPNPMLGSEKSARMVNSAGEEFFNQQQDDPLAYGPYTVQLKALAKQVHAGKARYDGGYYAGLRPLRRARGRGLHELRQELPPARAALSRGSGRGRRHRALPAGRHRRRHRDHALVGAGPLRRGRARRPQQRADRARDLRRQGGGRRRRGATSDGSHPARCRKPRSSGKRGGSMHCCVTRSATACRSRRSRAPSAR